MAQIIQLKITLEGIFPKIWRRFLVKDNITFQKLHDIIQIVMGWGNYHLYGFYVDKEKIGLPDPHFDNEQLNAKKIKIKDKLSVKQKFGYVYDFGDNWEHMLTVEKILDDKETAIPVCLEGERAGPPEDCGSYPGYYELMNIRGNKKHPEYKERIVEWLGEDFDFEKFNLNEINKELLIQNTKIDGRTRYWVPK
ncbi:MAG: plasmid pRiA4b ORF-3 family protein [Nanoarchaeota archaeon]